MRKYPAIIWLLLLLQRQAAGQVNLLLNGGFEDINTCTEYNAECGVEGWFYMTDVKVQLLKNDTLTEQTGSTSLAMLYNWKEYTGFSPVIGSLLPCSLQPGHTYTFRGLISVKLNPKLNFKPGICIGGYFYVPRRPFSASLIPDSLLQVTPVPGSVFAEVSYTFTATGNERYLTLGSYIHRDSIAGKVPLIGVQTVSWVIDQFRLEPADPTEGPCAAWQQNCTAVYAYNYRHKKMDYSLYGKGELAIDPVFDNSSLTQEIIPVQPPVIRTDTLKLGDVLFDFNKAALKPAALKILADYFTPAQWAGIDSIRIEGHTDSVGTDQRNLVLSEQRCISVQQWMQQHGLPERLPLGIRAFGKTRPVASNRSPEGRAFNRRVELILFRKRVVTQQ